MSSGVLSSRDINTQQTVAQPADGKPKSMDYHRQALESRMKDNHSTGKPTYISPSDNILSPASKKLSDFKSKHFMKKAKPQSLFSKAENTQSSSTTSESEMFPGIPKPKSENNTKTETSSSQDK